MRPNVVLLHTMHEKFFNEELVCELYQDKIEENIDLKIQCDEALAWKQLEPVHKINIDIEYKVQPDQEENYAHIRQNYSLFTVTNHNVQWKIFWDVSKMLKPETQTVESLHVVYIFVKDSKSNFH